MKILIVNNMAPFLWGGAEELAVNLKKNLILAGHSAEILRIPFRWEPANGITSQMAMVRNFELTNVDHVIALKFPAYLIRHPRKTLWLLHQYRQAYDLFDAGQTNLPAGREGAVIRTLIQGADNESFRESRRIFTNSDVTKKRLKHYNGFDAEILLPPLNDPELFTGGESKGYIFAGGRVNSMKRQHLLVEAMIHLPKHTKLIIAGPPDGPADSARMNELVKKHGLEERVKLDLRFLPREELAAYVNGAEICAYLPFDEDSLGYVTMEAATAGKATITTSDSGGVLGLVHHEETGWVAEPNSLALADAMNRAVTNRQQTYQMGLAARSLWDSMDATWSSTVARLIQ